MTDARIGSDKVSSRHPISGRSDGRETAIANLPNLAAIDRVGEIRLLDLTDPANIAVELGAAMLVKSCAALTACKWPAHSSKRHRRMSEPTRNTARASDTLELLGMRVFSLYARCVQDGIHCEKGNGTRMASLDRKRAEQLMAEAAIDAVILLSPESFLYATGASPGVATMWRRAGAVAALVPADAGLKETAVVSDLFAPAFRRTSHVTDVRESPIWVETANLEQSDPLLAPEEMVAQSWRAAGRPDGFMRPETFDPLVCYRHLADILSELGLDGARIGFEASAISARDFGMFKTALGSVELVDASELIARLKMVKTKDEIAHLRLAVEIAETGIRALSAAIQPGTTRDALAKVWNDAVKNHKDNSLLSGAWEYVSVGKNPWAGNATVQPGDLVKVDVGCLVNGYTSDTGRTFVVGAPNPIQARLYDALLQGFMAGAKMLRPGVPLSEVHSVTLSAIRAAGFPGYTRGHFGHGLGAGLGSEEWPFISAEAQVSLEPGMVMAFECPWYVDGLGGMIIENQLLITETGHEMMNTLTLDLVRIPV